MNNLADLRKEENISNGITLIALVLTIIVLLILAGISIATLTGENGLLTKSTTAEEQTKFTNAEEKVKLAVMASYNTNSELDTSMLKENLNAINGIETKVEEVSFNLTITVDGYNFVITKLGKVKSEQKGDILVPTITHVITPEEGTKASSVDIKITAQFGESGIRYIQKPDGTIENSNTTTYTVTQNGDYPFIIKDSDDNETTYTVTINNVILPKLFLYNRGVSSCGTFTHYHEGNGSGNFVIGNNYLELSTSGTTGLYGFHNAKSSENIGISGYKTLNVVYDITHTANAGSGSSQIPSFLFGTTKGIALCSKGKPIGSYTYSFDLSTQPNYEDSQLHLRVNADWTRESITVKIYEIYLADS